MYSFCYCCCLLYKIQDDISLNNFYFSREEVTLEFDQGYETIWWWPGVSWGALVFSTGDEVWRLSSRALDPLFHFYSTNPRPFVLYIVIHVRFHLEKKWTIAKLKKKRKKLETTNYTIMYEIRKKIRINGILTVIKMINGRWESTVVWGLFIIGMYIFLCVCVYTYIPTVDWNIFLKTLWY